MPSNESPRAYNYPKRNTSPAGEQLGTGVPDQLLVCIWHVPSKSLEAEGFCLTLKGALISFGKEVIAECQQIETVFTTAYLPSLLGDSNIKPNAAFLVCIITEAPQTSEKHMLVWSERNDGEQRRETLANLYQKCFTPSVVELLRDRFRRRTVIQFGCGVRLDSVNVTALQSWLTRTNSVDEIISPTNAMLQPARMLGVMLNLAMLLYSKGANIVDALPQAWLLDERGREHTGLLLLSPKAVPSTYIWSPFDQPFGQSLYYCSCGQGKAKWRQERSADQAHEWNSDYVCGKCGSRFTLELSPGTRFARLEALGTAYVTCQWPVPPLTIVPALQSKK